MMKRLGHRYAQYFNRKYGRSGPLWGGRYYSCIAESAFYVLACYRYIETNPVRAGLVARPADYRWSSHSTNARGLHDGIVSPHPEYTALAGDDVSRRQVYQGLFEQVLELVVVRRIRESTVAGYPLASDGYKAELVARFGTKLGRNRRRLDGSVPDPDPL
jgi:putative transposase